MNTKYNKLRSTSTVFLIGSLLFTFRALAIDGFTFSVNPFEFSEPSSPMEVETETCISFAGRWQGTCDGTDSKKDLQLTIEQKQCDSLTINGEEFPIDGLRSFNSSEHGVVRANSMALSWDSDKTRIIGNAQNMGQRLGKRRTFKFQYANKFSIEKEKQDLILTMTAHADSYVNETKRVDKSEMTCRLRIN